MKELKTREVDDKDALPMVFGGCCVYCAGEVSGGVSVLSKKDRKIYTLYRCTQCGGLHKKEVHTPNRYLLTVAT